MLENHLNLVIKELTDKTKPEIKKKFSTISENNSEILYLIINRWVGIDGVMAVISKKETLNFRIFLQKL